MYIPIPDTIPVNNTSVYKKFATMRTITIHTENESHINLLRALLEELKIKFEISKKELTDWQKQQLEEGIKQADNGIFYSYEEAEKIIDKWFK